MKPQEVKFVHWHYYNILFILEHFLGQKLFHKWLGNRQKKLYKKIGQHLAGQKKPSVLEVECVDKNMTREEFMKICYEPGLPKVFRGAAAHWPATSKWNLDFFSEKYGDLKIILNDNVGLADQKFEILNFRYYINQLKNGTLKYLRFSDVVNNNQELKDDFDMAWLRNYYLPFSWGEDTKMFMGGKNSLTPLHVGFSDFLFVQVMGRKKWILYKPQDRLFLDARTERTLHFYSRANPYQKDDPAFPLFKFAQQYEVYLEPGDVLWVPSFFWHHVENLSDSIGIRVGRSSVPSAFKSSKMFTFLTFLATKPNLLAHAITTRLKKGSLVFLKSQEELNKPLLKRMINGRKKKTIIPD